MEKIATDTYSFERLRTEGCVYVDKTAILKQLADGSIGTQFFIARPRRFGKSDMNDRLDSRSRFFANIPAHFAEMRPRMGRDASRQGAH